MIFKNKEFKAYKLEEVCEIHTGIGFKSSQFTPTGTPVLKKKNMQDGLVHAEGLHYCNPNNHPNAVMVRRGDIVIKTSGKGSAGQVGINLTDTEFVFTSDILKLDPKPEWLNNKYLYYFLLNHPEKIESCITCGNVDHLYKDSLGKLEISIPDLKTQKYIVSVLDKFTELKEELKEELRLRKNQQCFYRQKIMNLLSK